MNIKDQKLLAYDSAVKILKYINELENQEGWTKIVVPEIKKIADNAQEMINDIDTPVRLADSYRGELKVCNQILDIVENKRKNSELIMSKSII